MTLIRDIANHTLLMAIYKTSMKQAQMEYMQVQRDFLNTQAATRHPQLFTAQEIINYVEQHCVCSNEKSIQTIQMTINKMVRHNGQTLLQWLQSFIPPTNKYLKAAGKAQLNADEEQVLWKKHFSKQINLSEKGCMLMFQSQHLTVRQVTDIAKLPRINKMVIVHMMGRKTQRNAIAKKNVPYLKGKTLERAFGTQKAKATQNTS